MIKCIELDRDFATKQEMFKALLDNEEKIIGVKKAAIQKSCDKGQLDTFNLFKVTEETKSLLSLKEGYIYPVINTTKYLDSHNDVHFNGIWNKSVKEQQSKILYVTDHEVKTSTVIAWQSDVTMLLKEVPWSFVGKNYEGNTQALIFEIKEDAIENEDAKKIISKRRPVQNSVRMQYVKIRLAINDTAKEFAEHKSYFDSVVESIANKEVAMERGYFWGVEEAKIVTEGSMVPYGSNDATPIQYAEAAVSTSDKQEPSNDTQQLEREKEMIKQLIERI